MQDEPASGTPWVRPSIHMAFSILIIDDDPFIGEYLRDRLEAMGYHVIVARDGRTGLALIALEANQTRIRGVLLDLHMPIMDGMQVLQELRAQNRTLPVVVMTADRDHKLRERALALGATHHIEKPIDLGEFAEICDRIFPLSEQEP
jgi:CheY-like chemotaxis protein